MDSKDENLTIPFYGLPPAKEQYSIWRSRIWILLCACLTIVCLFLVTVIVSLGMDDRDSWEEERNTLLVERNQVVFYAYFQTPLPDESEEESLQKVHFEMTQALVKKRLLELNTQFLQEQVKLLSLQRENKQAQNSHSPEELRAYEKWVLQNYDYWVAATKEAEKNGFEVIPLPERPSPGEAPPIFPPKIGKALLSYRSKINTVLPVVVQYFLLTQGAGIAILPS